MSLFTLDNRKYFKCSLADRLSCRELIDFIVRLADKAQHSSIPELEKEADEFGNHFLSYVLGLYLDDMLCDEIRGIVEARMVASHESGITLLSQLLMLEGVLMIQARVEACTVEERLYAYLGDDVAECRRLNDFTVVDIDTEVRSTDERTHMDRLIYLLDTRVADLRVEEQNTDLSGYSDSALANVFLYLSTEQAAYMLSELPEMRRINVLRLLVVLKAPDLRVVYDLRDKLNAAYLSEDVSAKSRPDSLKIAADILSKTDRFISKSILDAIKEDDYTMSREIEKRMVNLDMLLTLNDMAIQRVCRELKTDVWVMALKYASDEIVDKILRNVSSRVALTIREDMDSLGDVDVGACIEAQRKVYEVLQRLHEWGEIIVPWK